MGHLVHFGSLPFTPPDSQVQSGSRGFTLVRLGVIVFICVLTLRSPVLFGFAWFHSDERSGRRVHSDSSGFVRARLAIAGFIPVCVGSLLRALG